MIKFIVVFEELRLGAQRTMQIFTEKPELRNVTDLEAKAAEAFSRAVAGEGGAYFAAMAAAGGKDITSVTAASDIGADAPALITRRVEGLRQKFGKQPLNSDS